MAKRCASCGEFNPRRTLNPDGDWVDYLVSERGASEPVGRLTIPLCNDCYADAQDVAGQAHDFLDGLDTDLLVDEVSG